MGAGRGVDVGRATVGASLGTGFPGAGSDRRARGVGAGAISVAAGCTPL